MKILLGWQRVTTPQLSWISGCVLSASLVTFLVTLPGCGGTGAISKAEMMRMARTQDPDDDEEEAAPPATSTAAAPSGRPTPSERPTPPPTQPVANTPSDVASNTPAEVASPAAEPPVAKDSGAESSPAIGGLRSIEDRRQDLSPLERRKRSIENIAKLNRALVNWIDKGPRVPRSVLYDSTNRPGLSWRVAILPELGYTDLYQKFNLKEPWDSPANKALLKYIPDEFVSPERFDENTNYQLFVNGTGLFSEVEAKDKTDVSDGPSIVILVEVDEDLRVPWTSPYDYDITEEPLSRGMGNLREDGAFVGWLTGRPSVWPTPVNEGMLRRALTFEAGDNMNFAAFMKYPNDQIGSGRPTFGNGLTSSSIGGSRNRTDAQPGNSRSNSGRSAIGSDSNIDRGLPLMVRQPLPSRDEVVAAESKMRAIYENEFKQARTRIEMAKLAKKIYDQLMTSGDNRRPTIGNYNTEETDNGLRRVGRYAESPLPPAELFVGLRSAFRVAIRGADANLTLQLLDELDVRYEIDRVEFESEMFEGLLGKKGSLRTELTKASELIPILEELILHNIENDNYKAAEANLDYGAPVIRNLNERETNYRWKVMRERVEEGKRRFLGVAKQLAALETNPDDPAANFAVGWYFCMVKENWTEGCQLLAKSKDRDLRALAILEIQNDSAYGRQLTLGDGWWNFAEKKKEDTLVFEVSMKRARHWYQAAASSLPDGLDRIRVNNRLDEIDRLIGKEELPRNQSLRN